MDVDSVSLVRGSSPAELFRDLVQAAAATRRAHPTPEAEFYLVDLLDRSVRADTSIHDATPLAELFLAAREAGPGERDDLLRRVGDRALFLSGVVPESLARRLVGVAYYARLGRLAYAELAEAAAMTRGVTSRCGVASPGDRVTTERTHRSLATAAARAELYGELSEHFADFVGILAEVGEHALGHAQRSLFSTCEKWLETGSAASADRLRRAGLLVLPSPLPRTVM